MYKRNHETLRLQTDCSVLKMTNSTNIRMVKKDASRKEIDEAIKRLDTEMSKIRKGVKENKKVDEVEIVTKGVKKERKCRYFNFGH